MAIVPDPKSGKCWHKHSTEIVKFTFMQDFREKYIDPLQKTAEPGDINNDLTEPPENLNESCLQNELRKENETPRRNPPRKKSKRDPTKPCTRPDTGKKSVGYNTSQSDAGIEPFPENIEEEEERGQCVLEPEIILERDSTREEFEPLPKVSNRALFAADPTPGGARRSSRLASTAGWKLSVYSSYQLARKGTA
jgi:hypothetical protein